MRNALALLIGAALLLVALNATNAQDKKPRTLINSPPLPAQYWKTRPVRRDTPLREENITDLEVAQIEAEMRSLYPGAVVYISAVTTGCPCEDGPDCTDLVWSVATLGDKSRGIAFSNIDGKWQVGPLQQWWLDRDALWAAFRASRKTDDRPGSISFREHMERVTEHNARFPRCSETIGTEDIRLSAL